MQRAWSKRRAKRFCRKGLLLYAWQTERDGQFDRQWVCMPGKECKGHGPNDVQRGSVEKAYCSMHGKQRGMDNLIDNGYACPVRNAKGMVQTTCKEVLSKRLTA